MTTNFEKIKNMTIEEMANFLSKDKFCFCSDCSNCTNGYCEDKIQQWLESENE